MFERFSDRARHAMALANLEASKFNHDYLAPAHLMLGLIAEGECVATEAMNVLNVDLEKVRNEVRAQLETGSTRQSVGRRAHTREMKSIIETSVQEARRFGHRYVGTEHLLLALLQEENAIPAKVLRKQGLKVEPFRRKALELLQTDVDAGHDLKHSRHGEFEWVHQQELAKAFRSPKFWHTLILAVDAANRKGADEVEPLHLLLALLRDSTTGIADMLAPKGVTVDWVSEQLLAAQNG